MTKIYRQGDVLLISTRKKPKAGAKELPRERGAVVLAHGEVTGHSHHIPAAECALYLDEVRPVSETDAATMIARLGGGLIPDRLLVCDAPVELKHEEHDTIRLPKGAYVVRLQREYNPQAIRNVAD